MEKLQFDVVPIDLDDGEQWAFLTSSFCQSIYQSTGWGRYPRQAVFAEINRILSEKKESLKFVFAVDPEDKNLFFGWACFDKDSVVFTYVKQAYRGQGIGCGLVKDYVVDGTIRTPLSTPVARKIAESKGVKLVETEFYAPVNDWRKR